MVIFSDLPFDEAGGHGGRRSRTQMVVIHATDNTASDTAEAHFAEHRPDHTSAHFYSDEDSVTQALDTDLVAYGCYPTGNARSVQFELVGASNHISDATMRRVAPVVARVCALYGLPVRKLAPSDLVGNLRGICGHADVTAAWGEGDHTDPGSSFPWSTFIGYVHDAAEQPQEADMSNAIYQVPMQFAFDEIGDGLPGGSEYVLILPVDNATGQDVSVACDLGAARLRLAYRPDGGSWSVKLVDVDSTKGRVHLVGTGEIARSGVISIGRCRTSPTDTASTTPVGLVVNTHA